MKCKSIEGNTSGSRVAGLIEAYWNVNVSRYFSLEVVSYGLIEAYWNVNIEQLCVWVRVRQGLIEAYWNVNVVEGHNYVFVEGV